MQHRYTMNLKMYLASINMTVKDFSEIMEVSSKYMSRIIHGHSKPSRKLSQEIEKATDGLVKITSSMGRSRAQNLENAQAYHADS